MDIFQPIQSMADLVVYEWFGIEAGSYLGNTLNFFFYDVIKLGLLLIVINYLMAISRYYFPLDKVREILTKRKWYGLDYLLAALLGVVTPFCSCSSIPLFIGFLSARVPLGVTFAFLISSPLINEASLYLFPATFGWRVTILYNLIGLVIAVLGGMLIQKLKFEHYIRPEFLKLIGRAKFEAEAENIKIPLADLLKVWHQEAFGITRQVFPYVLLGVGLGALIHGLVPESLVNQYLSAKHWTAVPAAVLLGAPLYANSVGVVPIVEALVNKGVPMGSALAFMTATVTISIPEGLMLAKLIKRPLLFTFFGITIAGIILMGYLFNFVL